MLIHITFWTGLAAGLLGLAVSVATGWACVGLIRQSLLASMKTTIECYRIELEEMKTDVVALKEKMAKMEKAARLTTAQLGMALRLIELFDRIVSLYVKRRAALPTAFVSQMDAAIQELAEFRERATLELESQEISQSFYDWIVTRATLSGPELFGARMPDAAPEAKHEPA